VGTNWTGSRSEWLIALVLVAAPLLLVAGSWSEITAGSSAPQSASVDSQDPTGEAAGKPTGPGARPLRDPRGYVAA
jgi:hypothetical protein